MTLQVESLRTRSPARPVCAHCGLPVPAGLIEPSAEFQYCCAGCRVVHETIHSCGLDGYYRLREAADEAQTRPPADPGRTSYAAFDAPAFQALYVRRFEGACSIDLVLENVSCAACVWLIEKLPRVLPGVIEARLNLRQATVRITWDPSAIDLSRIAATLARFGYGPHPAKGGVRREVHRREERRRLVALGVSGALMGNTMLLGLALYAGMFGAMEAEYSTFFRWLSVLLGTVSLAWPGATFFRSAWSALRLGGINLDVPIALALLVGGVAGIVNVVLGRGEIYFDSLTVLVFLLLVGRFLQFRQQRRADDAVELLFSLTPASCRVVNDDDTVSETPVEALQPGVLVEVLPGDLLPADGVVESGRSAVDQALLTGESHPVPVSAGANVFGGAQNVDSVLRVRVSEVGEATRVGRLLKLVEQGISEKPPIVQFTDRVGAWFTLAVVLVSLVTFGWWAAARGDMTGAIDHTVALLIVTCPCVLGLATPLTIAVSIGRLARRSVLVKSGAAIEKLGRVARGARLLLDKTGTLTEGHLALVRWTGDDSIRAAVAAVEARSTHPAARALVRALPVEPDLFSVAELSEKGDGGLTAVVTPLAGGRSSAVAIGSPGFVKRCGIALPGELASAVQSARDEGLTAVVIAVDGLARAVATLGDRVRDDSAAAVAALRRMGFEPSIHSGDSQAVVARVATAVGVSAAAGEVMPEQKLDAVRRSTAPLTVMVGDGVNDAAALAAADVGIAVHGGAEASLAAADVYCAAPGLTPLVDLVRTCRRTMSTIRRNLLVSLAYNLLAGALAATGVMNPMIAAILMPLSSATVLSLAVASVTRDATALRRRGGAI